MKPYTEHGYDQNKEMALEQRQRTATCITSLSIKHQASEDNSYFV